VLEATTAKAALDDIVEKLGSSLTTLYSIADQVVVEYIAIAVYKDQYKWIAFLAACHLFVLLA
jgi:hypothetical protein